MKRAMAQVELERLHPVVKLSPQPQLPFEFGLLNTNSDLRNTMRTTMRHRECCLQPIPRIVKAAYDPGLEE